MKGNGGWIDQLSRSLRESFGRQFACMIFEDVGLKIIGVRDRNQGQTTTSLFEPRLNCICWPADTILRQLDRPRERAFTNHTFNRSPRDADALGDLAIANDGREWLLQCEFNVAHVLNFGDLAGLGQQNKKYHPVDHRLTCAECADYAATS